MTFALDELRDFLLTGKDVKDLRLTARGEVEVEFDLTFGPVGKLPMHKTLPFIAVVRRHSMQGDTLRATLVAKSAYPGQAHLPTKVYRAALANTIAKMSDEYSLPPEAASSRAVNPEEVEIELDLRAVGEAVSRRVGIEVSISEITLGDPIELVVRVRPKGVGAP